MKVLFYYIDALSQYFYQTNDFVFVGRSIQSVYITLGRRYYLCKKQC